MMHEHSSHLIRTSLTGLHLSNILRLWTIPICSLSMFAYPGLNNTLLRHLRLTTKIFVTFELHQLFTSIDDDLYIRY